MVPPVNAIGAEVAPSARSTPLTVMLPVTSLPRVGVTVALAVPFGTITS